MSGKTKKNGNNGGGVWGKVCVKKNSKIGIFFYSWISSKITLYFFHPITIILFEFSSVAAGIFKSDNVCEEEWISSKEVLREDVGTFPWNDMPITKIIRAIKRTINIPFPRIRSKSV